jgi:hypothetical protein
VDYLQLVELFRDPPAPYRPMIFWLWNGEITPEGIREQVAEFAAKGCGGFFVHPMGEGFRLGDFLQGISPPYLSDEYLSLVRVAARCAREHGLLCWLYDEGGWPSGNAQGQVVAGHPEHERKRLVARRLRSARAEEIPANTIAAVGLPDVGVPVPIEPRDLAQALTPYPDVIIFTMESDPSFIDVLSPAAVRRFIEVTHERYAGAVGEYFGNVIPGIFTDETSLGGVAGGAAVPWTRELLDRLGQRLGRDPRVYLPLLFGPEAVGAEVAAGYAEHERVAARCEYYECVTELFREAYWEQITTWCHDHGLIHTGHVGGEDNLPDHLHFGQFFRSAGVLDAPGVDAIWRQLYPGQDNFPFPRFAGSALKRRPRVAETALANLAVTEANAVYGYGLEYGVMRWLADYQFQGGINLYAPMASYYTTAGGRVYGTMSHFGPGAPLWACYQGFADYIGRQCVLGRHTTEPADIAVYYPIETVWADPGAGAATWTSLKGLCGLLLESQRAFDFVDAETLVAGVVHDGALELPQARYRAVLVPCLLTMPVPALRRLEELVEAGVTVVFTDCLPAQACEMTGLDEFASTVRRLEGSAALLLSLSQLAEEVDDLLPSGGPLRLTEPVPELLLSTRRAGEAWVYLATNNSDRVLRPAFSLSAASPVVLEAWDSRDGEVTALLATGAEVRDFVPILPPWSSGVFVVRSGGAVPVAGAPPDDESLPAWLATPAAERPDHVPGADVLAVFWMADRMRLVEQAVVVDGELRAVGGELLAEGPCHLGLWEDWAALRDLAGRVEYRFAFTVSEQFEAAPLLLDLGEVYWAATVELNGRRLADSLWPPHTLDISRHVRAGDNTLLVTVASTLAAAVGAEEAVAEARARGWDNAYWHRAQAMMTDRRAGLVGPVRVLLVRPATE